MDGGNRGCEAIAKGTAMILNEKKENLMGLCTDVELDRRLGLDKFVTLQQCKENCICFKGINRLYKSIIHDEWQRKVFFYHYKYRTFLKQIKKDDIMLSTGGDMMCYDENQVIYTVNYTHRHGIRSVLWGCSIGENNLTPRKLYALEQFSLIYARETLTKETLENHGLNNVVVYPDPAFVLEPEECSLPECFEKGDVIGLNLSNFVMGGIDLQSRFARDVLQMMDYIIKETSFHILLIPHVLWNGQDDRPICKVLIERYSNDRISMLNVEELNYCQIRHVISKCRMFIGGRTHSVISAYSTCVPSIAVGYSIKAVGIAKDLGLPMELVVDSKSKSVDNKMLSAFAYCLHNYKTIQKHLDRVIPKYREKAYGIKNSLKSIV